jgi:hypothetical protein
MSRAILDPPSSLIIAAPMPTLPLLIEPPHPSGSHHVSAPGGYEGWYFDASNADGTSHIVAGLHEAWAFSSTYARRYWWYRRFPTRLTPPLPREFPAVTFALYRDGHEPVRFVTDSAHAMSEVRTTDDGRSVRIGSSHAERSFDELIRLNLRGVAGSETIAADLMFRPLARVNREITLIDDAVAGLHRWAIADALCEVEASVAIFTPDCGGGTPAESFEFRGRGFNDHRYGTRPAPASLSGRVLMADRAVAFTHIGDEETGHVVTSRADGNVDVTTAPAGGTDAHLRVGPLALVNPRLLEAGRFHALLSYEARVDGEPGVALCRRVRDW